LGIICCLILQAYLNKIEGKELALLLFISSIAMYSGLGRVENKWNLEPCGVIQNMFQEITKNLSQCPRERIISEIFDRMDFQPV
jgi:hypothetical protein